MSNFGRHASYWTDGIAFVAFLALSLAWPLVIGTAIAVAITMPFGRDASLNWCLAFAAPIAPYFIGRAYSHFHSLTKPRGQVVHKPSEHV